MATALKIETTNDDKSKIGTGAITVADSIDVQVTTAATRATVTGTDTSFTAGTDLVGAGSFTLNGKTFTTTNTTTRDQLVDMLNNASAETGVLASVSGGAFVLTNQSYGSDHSVNLVDTSAIIQSAASAASATGVNAVATVSYTDGTNTYTSTFNKGKGLELKDADGNVIKLKTAGNSVATHTNSVRVTPGQSSFQIGGNAGQTASLSLGNFSSASLSISTLDITGTSIDSAISALDAAITTVADARGNIGSFMKNTIESNVRSLGVARENLAATESAIRETDIAAEMTNYTKLQILSQSGLAMLAQANSAPQSVLSLLR